MPTVRSNNLEIAFETYGNNSDPTVLLIQGLSMPLSATPPEYIQAIVDAGFHVVAADNRDMGLSEKLDALVTPSLAMQSLRHLLRLRVRAPYQLDDMASDLSGLLDQLGVAKAHVVGISMGGMIAQLFAIHEPQRALSLTSIMSTTGRRGLPGPSKVVRRQILSGQALTSPEARYEHFRTMWRLIGSTKYRRSDEEFDVFMQRVLARGSYGPGSARQLLAIMAAPNRVEALGRLTMPVQVIHGADDPLVPVECGIDTAKAVPNAKFHEIDGMGHDLPLALMSEITQLIVSNANSVQRAAA